MQELGVVGIAREVAAGRLRAADVVRDALEHIERLNPSLHALRAVYPNSAMKAAKAIDARVDSGETVGRLAGVTLAVKDNLCVDASYGEGEESPRTCCGSRMLENYRSPFSATTVQRLIDEGAIIVGTANMDEFGMGSSGEYCFFGPTRNPHDHERVPGGSSSGSAAAVASGMAALALGSDTGGSIRQPAALTGIVGFKPSYGRVSRWGLVAYASSLDCVGPMTRTVEDAALALDVISGGDPLDSTCSQREAERASESLDMELKGLKIGVPVQGRDDRNDQSVNDSLNRSIEALREAGADVFDVELTHLAHSIPAYYIVAPAEASSNLARFDGVRYGHRASVARNEGIEALVARSRSEGFGPEVQRRIMLGTHTLSSGYYGAFYSKASKMRRLIKHDFEGLFDAENGPGCHALLMPATTGPAFRIGEKTKDPSAMYREDLYTVSANLAGLPAVCLPAGSAEIDGKTLPIGVQLLGSSFEDSRLLRIARLLERQLARSSPVSPLPH
ncbi:MAG: Asp-tRNA(Asn)/Glu-tRNA(Gln) amidotransferase subunit GatA [Phycisphaerales bacterium]